MSGKVKNIKKRRSNASRVRDLAQKKRKKKHEDESKLMILSIHILAIVAVLSISGYALDTYIGWEHPYLAISFMIMSIGISVLYAIKKFSK